MLRDDEVRDFDGQSDVLRAVGAAGSDLCREAFDLARGGESFLQYRLLKKRQQEERKGVLSGGFFFFDLGSYWTIFQSAERYLQVDE